MSFGLSSPQNLNQYVADLLLLLRTHRFIGVEGDEQGVGKTHAIASVLKFKAKQVHGENIYLL